MEEATKQATVKIGDRFIKPDSHRTYIVTKLVLKGGWVILKEKDGSGQILTSEESLETWVKCEKEESGLND